MLTVLFIPDAKLYSTEIKGKKEHNLKNICLHQEMYLYITQLFYGGISKISVTLVSDL